MSARAIFRPLCWAVGHGWEQWSRQTLPKWAGKWIPYWKCFRCGLKSDVMPKGWK